MTAVEVKQKNADKKPNKETSEWNRKLLTKKNEKNRRLGIGSDVTDCGHIFGWTVDDKVALKIVWEINVWVAQK